MEEQKQADVNWRENISEAKETLKVEPDTEVVVTFQDEGMVKESLDYGKSVVFGVKTLDNDETKLWYVNANNYALLGQIKTLGKLAGVKVKITRKGSKRSDTRYTIEKIE